MVAAGGVDDRDRLGVAHRAARLGEGGHARGKAGLDRVREREERVGAARRADRRVSARASRAALATAWRAASTRDVWPLPIPTSRRSLTSTIAFEVTPRTSRQARSRSSSSASVGARRVTHVHVRRVVRRDVGRPDEDGAAGGPDRRRSGRARPAAARRSASASSTRTRRFGLVARSSSASARTRARPRPRGRSRRAARRPPGRPAGSAATTPPKALTGSASSAASHASRSVGRSAAPHGFVCLTMTTPGPRSARPSADAAAASRTLL